MQKITILNQQIMKKVILIASLACAIISCSSPTTPAEEKPVVANAAVNNDSTSATKMEETAPAVNYPFTATYSSDWKIGNPENAAKVLSLYKALEDNNIDEFNKYLADSVISQSYDAIQIKTTKEDVIKKVKAYRNTLKTITEEFIAFVPLHSVDKNEDWVATWMKERVVRKDGTKYSTLYMETWRFRNDKIYYRGGYARY